MSLDVVSCIHLMIKSQRFSSQSIPTHWVHLTCMAVPMKRFVIVFVAGMLFFALTAHAQTTPPTPGPEVKRLGVFVGTWTGEGKLEDSPFGKGGLIKSTMTCAWYTGGFHLVCESVDVGPMGTLKAHSVYGYSVDKKQYFDFGIDSTGFGSMGSAKVDGSNWTFEGADTVGGKNVRFHTVVHLSSLTEMTYKSEFSEDGKIWKAMSEGKLTKGK